MRIKRKTFKAIIMRNKNHNVWVFEVLPTISIVRNHVLVEWYYIVLSWLMFQVYFGIGVKKGGEE